MSRRLAVVIVILLAFCVALYFLSIPGNGGHDVSLPDRSDLQNQSVRATQSIAQVVRSLPGAVSSRTKSLQNRSEHGRIQFREIGVAGRVVDQFDQPLANVRVEFEIDRSGAYSASTARGATTTDAHGVFTITAQQGAAIAITPKAEGYLLLATNNRVAFSGFFQGDPSHYLLSGTNRVIRMWKLLGPEPLVKLSKDFRFMPSNGPVHLDLLTGQMGTSDGDVQVTVSRPSGSISPRQRRDWSIAVEAVEGELREADPTEAQYTFFAPTNGYQTRVVVDRKSDDPQWSGQADLTLFMKSRRSGVYSKVGLSFVLNEEPNPCWLGIEAISNPKGSRNWEEDPDKISRIQRK